MSHRRTIGIITTFISGRFFEQIMSGIQGVARQNQMDILVVHGTPEHVALTQVGRQRVDGWIVLTYTQGLDLLIQQGKPMVSISARIAGQTFPAVFPDNRQGTEAIMDHLLAQGHRRIAFVGDTSIGDIQERYTTYQAVLQRHQIPVDPDLVLITDNPLADRGILAARRLMSPRLTCTAVVAGNDWTAIGLMRELQAHGYRIPEDAAIVGFDDIPESQITDPPLTTVRQRSDELGATGAMLLLAQMGGQPAAPTIHYVPTTFVLRESSGSSLMTHISNWTIPNIQTGPLWQVALSKELVRVLLPALSQESSPSPAQVWPEVDKLVHLLVAALENSGVQSLNRDLLQSIFTSPPILNANPEIFVEMLRVLETAGDSLLENHPDPVPARQRLTALRDQLFIEFMRSYRRRQNNSQRTLSEILQSQYEINQMLLQGAPQQVDWIKATPMYSGCLGLWTPAGGSQPPMIGIAGCFQRDGNSPLRAGSGFSAPLFPPIESLPSSAQKNEINTCLVVSVRTADHDWGMLAVSGPLISNDPWLEDNTVNTIEIYSGFLGLALEREALQESLRHASEFEQLVAERIHDLNYPVITLTKGLLLLPFAGILELERAPGIVANSLKNIQGPQLTTFLFDLSRVQVDMAWERIVIECARLVKQSGGHVIIIGMRIDICKRILEQESDIQMEYQTDFKAALEQLKLAES
jgi:DNA-binding LacI/PurR family transcriptional regulator/anti-anti-sigma regulatory factor